MKIIIMQGLPGSGKSTWIKENHPNAVVCSADHYFTDPKTGEYKFNPAEIGEAHEACFRSFLDCLNTRDGFAVATYNDIVVDNTNLSLWEMYPYISVALVHGYPVEVVRICADPEVCASRNVHGVPRETILRMAGRMEKPLKFWECSFREVQYYRGVGYVNEKGEVDKV